MKRIEKTGIRNKKSSKLVPDMHPEANPKRAELLINNVVRYSSPSFS